MGLHGVCWLRIILDVVDRVAGLLLYNTKCAEVDCMPSLFPPPALDENIEYKLILR